MYARVAYFNIDVTLFLGDDAANISYSWINQVS